MPKKTAKRSMLVTLSPYSPVPHMSVLIPLQGWTPQMMLKLRSSIINKITIAVKEIEK